MKFYSLALIFVISVAAHAQNFQSSDLFIGGTQNTHTFRIPALEVSIKGTVIAICDARRDNSADLPGNIDLVMRRSTDNGESWQRMQVILDLPEGHGCGDPSLIVDRITGRIFCFYAYAPPGISIHKAKPGSNAADDMQSQHIQYIYSDDDGIKWSEPVELNPMVKDPAWEGVFAASGHGIQTRKGRLIQPLVIKQDLKGDGSFQTHARNIYSDDHGKTWQVSEPTGLQVGETKVVELPDGTLMQNMRNRQLKYRSVAVSNDEGQSWSPMWQDSTLIGPRCNASITRYASIWEGEPYNIMAFSNPASQKGRKNMTVRFSFDNAVSWPIAIPINEGPSAYSSLIRLYDGSLGLLYETGKKRANQKIVFIKIDKKTIDKLLDKYISGEKSLTARPDFSPYYYHSAHQFSLLPATENAFVFVGNSISDGAEWHEYLNEQCLNRGISGDVTDGVLLRLTDITRLQPKKVFLMIGINDLAKGKSVDYVFNNHQKIYEQIKKESPQTQVYIQSVLPVNDCYKRFNNHTNKGVMVDDLNKKLKSFCSKSGLTYIDLHAVFSDADGKLRKDLTEDGLHLNGRGYQVWIHFIKQYVR